MLAENYNNISIEEPELSLKEQILESYKKLDEKCEQVLIKINTRKKRKQLINEPA